MKAVEHTAPGYSGGDPPEIERESADGGNRKNGEGTPAAGLAVAGPRTAELRADPNNNTNCPNCYGAAPFSARKGNDTLLYLKRRARGGKMQSA
jgi:hypothetical protein